MLPKLGLNMARNPTWAGTIAGGDNVEAGMFADEVAMVS